MATVAALALSVPAMAQVQLPPAEEDRELSQQPGTSEEILRDEGVVAPEEATPPPDMTFLQVQEEAQFLAADEVIGRDVVNLADEEIGEIADLVMDQDQKLVGIVLSVGGFLGMGEKWVAVPVDEIRFPTDQEPARLLTAATAEQLENAPDFVTRETVEAQAQAEQAQQRLMEQQRQPPPTTTIQ
jgi:hypothetical protein